MYYSQKLIKNINLNIYTKTNNKILINYKNTEYVTMI